MLFRRPYRRLEAPLEQAGERARGESDKVVSEEGDEGVERLDEDAEQACGAVWQGKGDEGCEDFVGELDATCSGGSQLIVLQAPSVAQGAAGCRCSPCTRSTDPCSPRRRTRMPRRRGHQPVW